MYVDFITNFRGDLKINFNFIFEDSRRLEPNKIIVLFNWHKTEMGIHSRARPTIASLLVIILFWKYELKTFCLWHRIHYCFNLKRIDQRIIGINLRASILIVLEIFSNKVTLNRLSGSVCLLKLFENTCKIGIIHSTYFPHKINLLSKMALKINKLGSTSVCLVIFLEFTNLLLFGKCIIFVAKPQATNCFQNAHQ